MTPTPQYAMQLTTIYSAQLLQMDELTSFVHGLQTEACATEKAVQRLTQCVKHVACRVFGKVMPKRLGGGWRPAKPWFKLCHEEWAALKKAIRMGSGEEVKACRRASSNEDALEKIT